jgi:kumamolisin
LSIQYLFAMTEQESDTSHVAVALPGSERRPAPESRIVGPVDGESRATVTVVLRRRGEVAAGAVMSRDELAAATGAAPADIAAVQAVLTGLSLTVDEVDAASRRLRVSGTVAALAAAFGAVLEQATSIDPVSGAQVEHRHRTGGLTVPAELAGIIVAVLGLDDRPQARAHFRAAIAAVASTAFTPLQLATAYAFPADTDGRGHTLAIVELGGGFAASEVATYFTGLGVPGPTVRAIGVDGAKNVPNKDPNGADGEVLLDIEVAGAVAPGADVVVYFAPNTDAGFLDAVATAAHATPTPTAISISWGQSEDSWTAQARVALDDALADAATLGVTVTVAAGDSGSSDSGTGAHVDFPASSPHALACGGTSLHTTSNGSIRSETVWNDGSSGGSTGGGISDVFALPSWQAGFDVPDKTGSRGKPGRGVPDVAGNADPRTGYQVLVDGSRLVIGGTSAVAPLWAGLICRLAQALGHPLGLLQPALYAASAGAAGAGPLHDITSGDNGAYKAGVGWDACTGLGTPDGTTLLEALRKG